MTKRKYEGLLTEEEENEVNNTEGMGYFEILEYWEKNPLTINDSKNQIQEIDFSLEELCERFGLVDMTSFLLAMVQK